MTYLAHTRNAPGQIQRVVIWGMERKGKEDGEGVLIITRWMGAAASLAQTEGAHIDFLDYFGQAIMGVPRPLLGSRLNRTIQYP